MYNTVQVYIQPIYCCRTICVRGEGGGTCSLCTVTINSGSKFGFEDCVNGGGGRGIFGLLEYF